VGLVRVKNVASVLAHSICVVGSIIEGPDRVIGGRKLCKGLVYHVVGGILVPFERLVVFERVEPLSLVGLITLFQTQEPALTKYCKIADVITVVFVLLESLHHYFLP